MILRITRRPLVSPPIPERDFDPANIPPLPEAFLRSLRSGFLWTTRHPGRAGGMSSNGGGVGGAGGGVGSRYTCTRRDRGEDDKLLTDMQEEGVP